MNEAYFFNSRLAKGDPQEYVVDKEKSCKSFISYMNARLQKMFHYEGLPDTIPREFFEYYVMNNGHCYITEVNEKLYALIGSFGGEPDPYYRPTKYVVANPALKLSNTYDLQDDGVLMRNDCLWIGLYPLMSRYATLMAENTLTIRTADIMLRVIAMLTAPDDRSKTAAEAYLNDLEQGKLGVIGEKRFLDEGIKMQNPPSSNGSYLTQFIELNQYLIGSFYNEIGLNANFNMKRESIGEGESSLNEDSLLPLCEEMLRCRKEDFDKVNKKYGTNITVEFDSAWLNNQKEIALQFKQMEVEASQLAEGSEDNERSDDGSGTTDDDGSGAADDSINSAGSEDIVGTEHNTDEHNDSSTDENSDRGDTDNQDERDQGADDETDNDSEKSGEDVLVDEREKEKENG